MARKQECKAGPIFVAVFFISKYMVKKYGLQEAAKRTGDRRLKKQKQ